MRYAAHSASLTFRDRFIGLASDPGPFVLRVIALLPWLWAGWLYTLFAFTALRFQEWPHRPGDHRFSSCAKSASPFTSGEYCSGTFDPTGHGFGFAVLAFLVPFVFFALISWIPVSHSVGRATGRSQLRWHVIFASGMALVVLTATIDPLGAPAWIMD